MKCRFSRRSMQALRIDPLGVFGRGGTHRFPRWRWKSRQPGSIPGCSPVVASALRNLHRRTRDDIKAVHLRISNASNVGDPASVSTCTRSTHACRGPRRAQAVIRATASAEPCATISTDPSGRLRTHPVTEHSDAASCAAKRKPTPWTEPWTTRRIQVADVRDGHAEDQALLVCGQGSRRQVRHADRFPRWGRKSRGSARHGGRETEGPHS